jgi:aminocarboxymuconate-semialdehyde decarboxylase
MDYGWSIGAKGHMSKRPSELARRFWYDSIVYDKAALSFLGNAVGNNRVVVGSDYPYAIRQKRPGAFVRTALTSEAVFAVNALDFLGHAIDVKRLGGGDGSHAHA